MKLFSCPSCGATVHFPNSLCTACGAEIGFAPAAMAMVAPGPDGTVEAHGRTWRKCTHYAQLMGCNWMVDDAAPFCAACRLNRTIPDLSQPGNLLLWQRMEEDKRRLVYAALRLGLPVAPQTPGAGPGQPGGTPEGLAFDFLADQPPSFNEGGRVLTGHAGGLITLNIAEADPALRERMRAEMAEPYRTILGHFRHESGHFYWDRLVRDGPWLGPFRACFGDETADYGAALQQHYTAGAPPDWPDRFVSAYAAAHPWEDWAESWSHYLHMVDTLETAWAFGLQLDARNEALSGRADFDPYVTRDFDALVAQWLPLTVALNALNAAMGHEAAYPFTLGPVVLDKLRFVHRVIHGADPARVQPAA